MGERESAERGGGARRGLVVIPAYNEERMIGQVLDEVLAYPGLDIVVVDDCSTDATRSLVQQRGVLCFPMPFQVGAWGAVQAGIRYAKREDYDFVVSVDADGQHRAEDIDTLIAPVLAGEADVTIGACPERGSRLRKIAWVLLKALSGLDSADITSGFRVYNRKAIAALASSEANLLQFQDIGVLCLLQDQGLVIGEAPVQMRERTGGKSKLFYSWRAVSFYMLYSVLLGISKRAPKKFAPVRSAVE